MGEHKPCPETSSTVVWWAAEVSSAYEREDMSCAGLAWKWWTGEIIFNLILVFQQMVGRANERLERDLQLDGPKRIKSPNCSLDVQRDM